MPVEEVSVSKSHRLSRLRQAFFRAEATNDRPQDDAGAVPTALGIAKLVPAGCTRLCKDTISLAKKIGLGRKGSAQMKQDERLLARRRLAGGAGSIQLERPGTGQTDSRRRRFSQRGSDAPRPFICDGTQCG